MPHNIQTNNRFFPWMCGCVRSTISLVEENNILSNFPLKARSYRSVFVCCSLPHISRIHIIGKWHTIFSCFFLWILDCAALYDVILRYVSLTANLKLTFFFNQTHVKASSVYCLSFLLISNGWCCFGCFISALVWNACITWLKIVEYREPVCVWVCVCVPNEREFLIHIFSPFSKTKICALISVLIELCSGSEANTHYFGIHSANFCVRDYHTHKWHRQTENKKKRRQIFFFLQLIIKYKEHTQLIHENKRTFPVRFRWIFRSSIVLRLH